MAPIEAVEVGDKVYAIDPDTGESGYFEVIQLYSHPTHEVLHVTIGDNILTGEVMEITPNHPIYIEGQGWVDAEDLVEGDRLRRKDGGWAQVLAIEQVVLDTPVMVYNFTVQGVHTYFVLEVGVLVHNCVSRVGTPPTDRNVLEVPIDELNPIHDVPRAGMPENHIDNLAGDIKREGFNLSRPVSATRLPNRELWITGGHHRLEAMRRLGETTIPVQIFDAADTPPAILAQFLGIGRITGKYQGKYYPKLKAKELEVVRNYLQRWKAANPEQVKFDFLP